MAHYYSEKQDSRLDLKKIKIKVKNIEFGLFTGSGVFSKDRLDKGTQILIENAIVESKWDILDLGCGIGVVGISLKLLFPEIKVTLSDVNERALMLSDKNIKLHSLRDIKAVKSDIYSSITSNFDTILVNPPQTAGRDVCYKIIEFAPGHLKQGGILQLVARHNKGGSTLKKKMLNVFGNAIETVKDSGYRVYVSKKE